MLIDSFNNTINIWIAELEHYSFNEICTKPGPESWSLGQVYMHLINETSYYIEQIESCLRQNENASEEMTDDAKIMFAKNEFPDERIKGDPFISENVKQPFSTWQLQKEMQELKSELNILWAKIIDSSSTGKTKHPRLNYFNAREWFQYTEMHLRHHLKQKARIDDFLKKVV